MDRLLGRKEVLRLVPYSQRHLYRLEAAGLFPRRVRVGRNKVGWWESQILAWLGSLGPESPKPSDDQKKSLKNTSSLDGTKLPMKSLRAH